VIGGAWPFLVRGMICLLNCVSINILLAMIYFKIASAINFFLIINQNTISHILICTIVQMWKATNVTAFLNYRLIKKNQHNVYL